MVPTPVCVSLPLENRRIRQYKNGCTTSETHVHLQFTQSSESHSRKASTQGHFSVVQPPFDRDLEQRQPCHRRLPMQYEFVSKVAKTVAYILGGNDSCVDSVIDF